MNILYDYQIFSSQKYGGISRYFIELVRHLSAQPGIDAKILAPCYRNRYAKALTKDVIRGFHVPEVPRTGRLLTIYNRIISNHWADGFKPDIIHETYYTDNPIRRSNGAVTVVTVYDMIHEKFSHYFHPRDKTAVVKRRAVERADHVICISETTRRDLQYITGLDSCKMSVVYLGVDLLEGSEEKKGRNLIGQPYLLYVGNRRGYKNFDRLLTAYGIRRSINEHCKLVCFGGGKFSSSELRAIARLGLPEGRVVWIEGGDGVLAQLYDHALAFVYPSLYEGFGIPPLEAAARGCPVVCSNGGSIPEVVGDAGEFFDPYDANSIAIAVERVISDSERRKELRALGKQRVSRFSWSSCARETYKIYESLM